MDIHIYSVDAFTSTKFSGNPASVCVLNNSRETPWMQAVAREMNLSATAFVQSRTSGGYDLRWFTRTTELDLCGHATLATAHVLWESGRSPLHEALTFHTRSGMLSARRVENWIELNFPSTPDEHTAAPQHLSAGLGTTPLYVGKSRFDLVVELESESAVLALKPNFGTLAQIAVRGIIVTSRSASADRDFVSRYFAPAYGINEDPVTGSAHCCLAPFWRERLGKDSFVAHQISPRGGVLKVRIEGDRVILSGQAVTVFRGELLA